jgi:hypothetical protein
MKYFSLLFICSLFIAGCSTPAAVRSQGATTRMALLNPDNAATELFQHPVPADTDGFDSEKNAGLTTLCRGGEEPKAFAAPKLVFDFLVKPLIAQLLGNVQRRIQAEIEAYAATYGASITTDSFYSSADPQLEPAWTCFRFTRLVPDDSGGDVPTLDLVGQLRLTVDRGALLVRPLRLYYASAAAPKGDSFGLAISLKSASVWLDGASRKTEETFDVTLINEHRSTKKPSVRYYFDDANQDELNRFRMVKLVPWTRRTPHDGPTGNAVLTVTVAEMGNAPTYLKQIAQVFDDRKDDLGELLEQAAASALGAN